MHKREHSILNLQVPISSFSSHPHIVNIICLHALPFLCIPLDYFQVNPGHHIISSVNRRSSKIVIHWLMLDSLLEMPAPLPWIWLTPSHLSDETFAEKPSLISPFKIAQLLPWPHYFFVIFHDLYLLVICLCLSSQLYSKCQWDSISTMPGRWLINSSFSMLMIFLSR